MKQDKNVARTSRFAFQHIPAAMYAWEQQLNWRKPQMHDFLITSGVTESPIDTSCASKSGAGFLFVCFVFILLHLWFSFSKDGENFVSKNKTAASSCEWPSSIVRELNNIALLISQNNSLWYRATPMWCPQETACLPRPLCTRPQLMTDGSNAEGHLYPWAGKKNNVCITMRNVQGEACTSNASRLCIRDRESHRNLAGTKLKNDVLTLLFSPHTWRHARQPDCLNWCHQYCDRLD